MIVMDADKMIKIIAPVAAVADGEPITIDSDGVKMRIKSVNEARVHTIQATVDIKSEPVLIHLDPENLMNALKDLSNEGNLKAEYDDAECKLILTGKSGKRSMRTIAIDKEIKMPKLVDMDAGEVSLAFLGHIPMLSKIDETVTITTNRCKIYMEIHSNTEEAVHWADIEITPETVNMYPAGIISDLVSKIKLDKEPEGDEAPMIKIHLRDEYPMKLEWSYEGVEYEYYVAPRL